MDPCISKIVRQARTGVNNLRPPILLACRYLQIYLKIYLKNVIYISHLLVQETDCIMDDHYLAYDFKVRILVAFYAWLRVGEMTKVASHCLLFLDVLVMRNTIHITYWTYKYCQGRSTTRVVFAVHNSYTCLIKR